MSFITEFISNRRLSFYLRRIQTGHTVSKTGQKAQSLRHANDVIHNGKTVKSIIEEHVMWIETNGEKGIPADFSGAILRSVDLHGVNLFGVNLQKADISGTDLSNANLWGANFGEAVLWRCNLHKAILVGADFHKANLSGANMKRAFLWDANLKDANLKEANFQGADLSFASMDNCKELDSIIFSKKSVLRQTKADGITWDSNIPLRKQWEYQNFLYTFKCNHGAVYTIWKIICNCGESISRWFLWSLLLLFIFGFIYAVNPSMIDPGNHPTPFSPYYFSVVTFVTLGYGDVTPACWEAQVLANLEVFFGYISLGGLITIFAKKIVV